MPFNLATSKAHMDISSAIQNRQLLAFTYDGFERVVEPHCYGMDTKGHDALRAYQVRGGSESGEYRGWKLFHTREIRQLTLLPDQFRGPRPGYKRDDKAFSRIQAQL
jgi:predicted DNA-binding transcriptional regulator YafY